MFIHTYITFFFFFSFDLVVLMFFSTTFNYTRTICIEIVYLFIFFEHGLVRVLLLTGEYFYPRGRSYLVVCIVLVSEQSDERIGLTILYACRFFFFCFSVHKQFFYQTSCTDFRVPFPAYFLIAFWIWLRTFFDLRSSFLNNCEKPMTNGNKNAVVFVCFTFCSVENNRKKTWCFHRIAKNGQFFKTFELFVGVKGIFRIV